MQNVIIQTLNTETNEYKHSSFNWHSEAPEVQLNSVCVHGVTNITRKTRTIKGAKHTDIILHFADGKTTTITAFMED